MSESLLSAGSIYFYLGKDDFMEVRVNHKTKEWIKKQGNTISVTPIFVSLPGKNRKFIFDYECEWQLPQEMEKYYRVEGDGLTLYVNNHLPVKSSVLNVWVRGCPPFEHVEIKGLKRFSEIK
ncbi:hypothetical protein [Alkalicoccus saliphilus]|uniref:Uncharacterized protein n=1 Tax=Alkalicoccus saliphilus TaxID=200989 RepID=A0A2T4U363_9BACI|nr:hypothetical protein [Alkalicoccus saliphilus]PTL37844.1 hypothetical protein C6Y45_14305 [Alkalicoccus saliphilus]